MGNWVEKFKPEQKVIVPNFMINGARHDVSGLVKRYVFNASANKLKVEVCINTINILLPEERLIDYEEYHAKKKASND